jgi:hypothetical protein
MSEQLTLFSGGSHANPSAWRVTKKDGTTIDTFGLNFRGWSRKLDLVGSLLKTYLESCELPQTTFVRTWSVSATRLGFGVLKLRLSERRTGEQECSLWRTPDAHCNRGAQSPERFAASTEAGRLLTLNDQVAHLFPTPTVHGNYNRAGASKNSGNGLATAAGGALNPNWVEWLMGFPLGWTDISGGELNRMSPEPPEASLIALTD